jgi:hypothetical protein
LDFCLLKEKSWAYTSCLKIAMQVRYADYSQNQCSSSALDFSQKDAVAWLSCPRISIKNRYSDKASFFLRTSTYTVKGLDYPVGIAIIELIVASDG